MSGQPQWWMVRQGRLMVIVLVKGLDEYSDMLSEIEVPLKDDTPVYCG